MAVVLTHSFDVLRLAGRHRLGVEAEQLALVVHQLLLALAEDALAQWLVVTQAALHSFRHFRLVFRCLVQVVEVSAKLAVGFLYCFKTLMHCHHEAASVAKPGKQNPATIPLIRLELPHLTDAPDC